MYDINGIRISFITFENDLPSHIRVAVVVLIESMIPRVETTMKFVVNTTSSRSFYSIDDN